MPDSPQSIIDTALKTGIKTSSLVEFIPIIIIPAAIVVLLLLLIIPIKGLFRIQSITKKLKKINSKASTAGEMGEGLKESELKLIWSEYSESFIRDKQGNIKRNTKRPHDFFNREHIFLEMEIDDHVLESFGSHAVAVGILGTFLGLVASIYGLNTGNSEMLKDGIEKLLDGAGSAFWTSIIGIFASFLFNWRKNVYIARFNRQIHKLNTALEEQLEFITSEKILLEQTEVLRDIDEHLNLKLDEAPNKIALELKPVFESIRSAVEQLNESGSKAIEKNFETSSLKVEDIISKLSSAVEKMVHSSESFSNQVSTSTDLMSRKLVEMGDNASKQMENSQKNQEQINKKTSENLEQLVHRMMEAVSKGKEEMGKNMTESVNKIAQSQQHIDKHIKTVFENILENQNNIYTTNREASKENVKLLTDVHEKFQSNIEKLINLSESWQEKEKVEERARNDLLKVSHDSQKNITTLKSILEQMVSFSKSLQGFSEKSYQAIQKMREANSEIHSVWKNYDERFAHIDKYGEEFFKKLASGIEGTWDKFHKHLKDNQEQIEKSCNNFAVLLEGLKELLEGLKELVEELNETKE